MVIIAERRMFCKEFISGDDFLDLPATTRDLYFFLSMNADDDGFVNSPKNLQRLTGANSKNLQELIDKDFIILFDSGVVLIKHWLVHNKLRKDRYKETRFKDEKSLVTINNKDEYILVTEEIISGNQKTKSCTEETKSCIAGKVSVVKDSIGKESIVKDRKRKPTVSDLEKFNISEKVKEKLLEFTEYRKEIKKPISERSFKTNAKRCEKYYQKYGQNPIISVIDDSIANGWQGIFFDRLDKQAKNKTQDEKTDEFVKKWLNSGTQNNNNENDSWEEIII